MMKNKICLITGGTSGVGLATALACAQQQATVVLTSRQAEKAAQTAKQLAQQTGNHHIFGRSLNLADFQAVENFAKTFADDFAALHVLSNNAAILPMHKSYNAKGIEKIFAVNYLGHFLLTHLLQDLLVRSAPARVLTVSGNPGLIKNVRLDLRDLNMQHQFYHPLKATTHAAAAKVAFSYELAKRHKTTGVVSNTFHPGLVKSNLAQNFPQPVKLFAQFGMLFISKTCETSAFLATSPQAEKLSGQFVVHSRPVKYTPKIPLETFAADLWKKSEELVGLKI